VDFRCGARKSRYPAAFEAGGEVEDEAGLGIRGEGIGLAVLSTLPPRRPEAHEMGAERWRTGYLDICTRKEEIGSITVEAK
jgi:hypothetical protein